MRERTYPLHPGQVNLLLSDLVTHGAVVTKNPGTEEGTISQDGETLDWIYENGVLTLTVTSSPLVNYKRAADIFNSIETQNSVRPIH